MKKLTLGQMSALVDAVAAFKTAWPQEVKPELTAAYDKLVDGIENKSEANERKRLRRGGVVPRDVDDRYWEGWR